MKNAHVRDIRVVDLLIIKVNIEAIFFSFFFVLQYLNFYKIEKNNNIQVYCLSLYILLCDDSVVIFS